MKLGIIIYSTDAETVWNAFRLGALLRSWVPWSMDDADLTPLAFD